MLDPSCDILERAPERVGSPHDDRVRNRPVGVNGRSGDSAFSGTITHTDDEIERTADQLVAPRFGGRDIDTELGCDLYGSGMNLRSRITATTAGG